MRKGNGGGRRIRRNEKKMKGEKILHHRITH
jgi:hypothetical protein